MSWNVSYTALLLAFFLLTYPFLVAAVANPTPLDLCALNHTGNIPGTNHTWSETLDQPFEYISSISYLRPDVGGALLPYIYTIVIILIHIPMVVIRVVRWEKVQAWSLAATVLELAVVVEAYYSTKFEARQILTWTPLMLVIDAGSTAQIFFLIVEDRHLLRRAWMALRSSRNPETTILLEQPPVEQQEYFPLYNSGLSATLDTSVLPLVASPYSRAHVSSHMSTNSVTSFTDQHLRRPSSPPTKSPTAYGPLLRDSNLYIAIGAALLLIVVITLQCLGLARAKEALGDTTPIVSYCSPIFQPFGLAVLDSNCNVYPIRQNFGKGVGCIAIPGLRQVQWLKATVAGTTLGLVAEAIDVVLLTCVHSKTRWRGLKMRRPWCSMIGGLIVLGATLIYGITYASTLPESITDKVWVVEDDGVPTFFNVPLSAGGLRGEILGWTDGVFSSWNATYFGSDTQLF